MSEQYENETASAQKTEQDGTGFRVGRSVLRWLGRFVAALVLFLLGALGIVLALLHTGAGDALLTAQVPALVNSLQLGLTMEVDALHAPLPAGLEIRGLRLSDAKGRWLELESACIRIPFLSLLPGISGWDPEVELVEVQNLRVARVPELPAAEATSAAPATTPAPLTLLPSWMRLHLRAVRLSGVQLGSALLSLPDRQLEASLEAQAVLGERTASVHLDIPGMKLVTSGDDVAAATGEVGEEEEGASETLEASVQPGMTAEPAARTTGPEGQLRLSLDLEWVDGSATIALKTSDSSFLPYFFPELESAALEARMQVDLPLVPPAQEGPLRAVLDSRFSLAAEALPEAQQQATLALNVFWDGRRFSLEKLGLDMPEIQPQVSVHGGGGFDPVWGPGADIEARIADLQLIGRLFGMSPQELSGALEAHIALGQGKQPVAWWKADAQEQPVSGGEVLRADVQLASPQLTVPGGQIQNLDLRIQGASASGTEVLHGLPDALSGTIRCSIASLFGMGGSNTLAEWQVSGLTGEKLGAALRHFSLVLPGVKLLGDLQMNLPAGAAGPLLDGSLDASVTDWKALSRLSGTALAGEAANMKLRAATATGKQSLQLHWDIRQLAMGDTVRLRSCQGDVSSADVYGVLEEVRGALTGKAAAPGGPALEAGIRCGEGHAGGVRWDSAVLEAHVRDAQAQGRMEIRGALAAVCKASFQLQDLLLRIQALQVQDKERELGLRLEQPVDIALKDGVDMKALHLALMPQGSLRLTARYLPSDVRLETAVEGIPLHVARKISDLPIFGGMLSLHARIRGNPEAPQGEFTLTAADIPVGEAADAPSATVNINGKLGNIQRSGIQPLQVEATLSGLEDPSIPAEQGLKATASIPLRFGKTPGVAIHEPLRAKAFWRGSLAPLWRFVPLPGRTLRGQGELTADVRGTIDAPRIAAGFFVGGAVFEDKLEGIQLRDIALEARYNSHGKSLVRLSASDGRGGTLGLDGTLLDTATQPRLFARGVIHRLRPLHRDDLAIQLSGTMNVSGALAAPQVQADITLDQGAYQIIDLFGGGVTTLENVVYTTDGKHPIAAVKSGKGPSAAASGPTLDIRFRAPGRFFIRGKGLDSEWKADLALRGEASNPRLTGFLAPVRGSFDFIGRSFSFGDSEIRFDGSMNPLLNLDLDYKTTQFTAQVLITGTARRPRLNLSSIPEVPKDEIMSQILFGKDTSSLSRYEAIQAAAAVASFMSGDLGALDMLTKARDTLGLDSLRVGSSDADRKKSYTAPRDASQQGKVSENSSSMSPTLEAGKYITDKIYVGVEQGMDPGTGTTVHVTIDVLPNVSLEGRTSSESSGIGINWKKDY